MAPDAGAVTLCACAPPSDHDEKLYELGPSVCGDGALRELLEPMMTVRLNAVAADVPLTASCSPAGLD